MHLKSGVRAARFHSLEVAEVRRETPDAVSIRFVVPPELADAYRFRQGQYVTLRAEIDGAEMRRSYSICSGLDDGELCVAVKRIAGGRFSGFANDNLKPGMRLDVMTPDGRFTWPLDPTAARRYVAFAAGSGITPLLSIVRTVLAREPLSFFTLFYGNRTTASILFREALDDLKDRFLGRLAVFHVLSREGNDVPLFAGRLDTEKVRAFAGHLFDPVETDRVFLCGPGSMIAEVGAALRDLGVAEERIMTELFAPADDAAPPAPASARAQEAAEAGVTVEAVLDGARRRFVMTGEDASVVDAGHRHGVELPFSCKGGMCCTCRARLVEGEVEMAANWSLEPWELEAGYVLTCQARPLTDRVVVDYDQV